MGQPKPACFTNSANEETQNQIQNHGLEPNT